MHRYLMEFRGYFNAATTFVVEASNKTEALEKGKQLINSKYKYDYGVKKDSLRVVKKMKG